MEDERIDITKQHETDYEKAMKTFLDENIDIYSQGSDVEELEYNSEFDRTNEMLLKYYNEKTGSDFQKVLKEILGVEAYKKLKKRLRGTKLEIEDTEREEQIRDMSDEVFENEEVDEETKQRAIKKVEMESGEKSQQEIDFKAELMKSVYEEAFERYDDILTRYKNMQLRNESMTVGDKEGTELVLSERYLNNMEKNYSKYANSKGLEVKNIDQDEQIKAKKEKLENEMKRLTKTNDLNIEDNIARIRIIFNRRNEIAEKMADVSKNRDNMSPEQFKASMDYYQQEYFNLTVEIRSQDPTLEMYQQEIVKENENIEYSNRTIGARNDKIVAGSYQEMDSYGNVKEDLGDSNLEQIQDITQDYGIVSQNSIDDLIKEAQDALEKGDLSHASEAIQSAEIISFGREISYEDSNEDITDRKDEDIKDNMDETEKKDEDIQEESNSFMQEMESGVASEKEAQLQERLRTLKENNLKDEENLKMQQNDLEQQHVRTRFSKK